MSGHDHGSASRHPQLLLADEDPASCETVGRAFARRGFQVTIAHTVGAAVTLATERSPEYAIVALRLPDGSGLDLITKLKGLDRHMRIVVLTRYGSIATAIEAIKLGATYYLCKPAPADDIMAAFFHDSGNGATPLPEKKPMSIKRLEWEYIWEVLQEQRGNVSQAARALSMHRRTLQRKLSKRPAGNSADITR